MTPAEEIEGSGSGPASLDLDGSLPDDPDDLYAWVRHRNEVDHGRKRFEAVRKLGTELHPSSTDLIAELIQNAEDARASRLGFEVIDEPPALVVWNDGDPLTPANVAAIGGFLDSSKSEGAIGYFGIGFKSVLTVCDEPAVRSGRYSFWLRGCLDPEAADDEELPGRVRDLAALGHTVFLLPLRPSVDVASLDPLRDRLDDDDVRLLLFLDRVRQVEWLAPTDVPLSVELERAVVGSGLIRMNASREDSGEASWLRIVGHSVLTEEVAAPIIAALRAAGSSRSERVESAIGTALPVRLVFETDPESGAVRETTDGMLASGLPTDERTGLRFHIEGWIPLSISRAQAKLDDPLSIWTIGEIAKLAAGAPATIRSAGRWDEDSVPIVPLEGEVAGPFHQVAAAIRDAVSAGPFVFASSGRSSRCEELVLAHRSELYEILNREDVAEAAKAPLDWPSIALRQGRGRRVLEELGVRELSSNEVVSWLRNTGSTDPGRLLIRGEEWLLQLLGYLAQLPPSELTGLEVVPTDAGMVAPGLATRPPPGALLPVVEKWRSVLAIVQPWVVADPRGRAFLSRVNVQEFSYGRLFDAMARRLARDKSTTVGRCAELIEMVSAARDASEIGDPEISRLGAIPWLRCGTETVAPAQTLLGRAYGNTDVEDYARLASLPTRHVSPSYLRTSPTKELGRQKLLGVLTALGCQRLPRVQIIRVSAGTRRPRDEAVRRSIAVTSDALSSNYEWELYDTVLEGLDQLLATWSTTPPDLATARCVFRVLALTSAANQRVEVRFADNRGQTTLRLGEAVLGFFHYTAQHTRGDSAQLDTVRATPWLFDQEERQSTPGSLITPTLSEALGPEWPTLHPSFIEGLPPAALKAAEELLDLQTEASTEAVLDHLRALARQAARPARAAYETLAATTRETLDIESVRDALRDEALIWLDDAEWIGSEAVCWDDPEGSIPSVSKTWPSLQDFFIAAGVARSPTPRARVLALLRSPTSMHPLDRRVEHLVRALQTDLLEGHLDAGLRRLLAAECWPARRSDRTTWARPESLVVVDDNRRGRLFAGIAPMWPFTGVNELPLALDGLLSSDASPHFLKGGIALDGTTEVDRPLEARLIWVCRLLVPLLTKLDAHAGSVVGGLTSIQWVEGLQVGYRLGDAVSAPDPQVKAWLATTGIAIVDISARKKMAHYIGDSIAILAHEPRLRELVKDLWRAQDEDEAAESVADLAGELGVEIDLMAGQAERSHDEGDSELSAALPSSVAGGSAGEPARTAAQPASSTGRASGVWTGGSTEQVWRSRTRSTAEAARGPGWGASTDAEWNAAIEADAIAWVRAWFAAEGHRVRSVERDRVGYDLHVDLISGGTVLVEVKGRSVRSPTISVSKNEYDTARAKGASGDRYLLVVVLVVDGAIHAHWALDPATVDFAQIFDPTYSSTFGRWSSFAKPLEGCVR